MILPGIDLNQMVEGVNPTGGASKHGGGSTDLFSGIMTNIMKRVSENKGAEQGKELKEGIREKKPDLIDAIKKYLLSKGISLDQVVADDTALSKLKHFLESAGLNGNDLDKLMGELKSNAHKKGVRLSDLFAKLSELKDTADDDVVMDISAIPFIESILSKLLPDPKDRQAALKGVAAQDKGVSLSQLVENLRQIMKQQPETGQFVPNESDGKQLPDLLAKFGMNPDKGVVTLDRFTSHLEGLMAQAKRGSSRRRPESKDLKGFFDHLKPVADSKEAFMTSGNASTTSTAGLKGVQELKAEEIPQKVFNAARWGRESRAPQKTDGQPTEHKVIRLDAEAVKSNEAPTEAKPSVSPADGNPAAKAVTGRIPTPEPRAPVRTLPTYVLNQVSRQIVRSHDQGMRDIELQLKPPHLGRIQMHIERADGGIRVNIVTEQAASREILLSHAGELKTNLAEQGLRVERVDIQYDQNFEQSMAHARHESNRSRNQRQQGARSNGDPDQPEAADEPARPTRSDEGVLDLVA